MKKRVVKYFILFCLQITPIFFPQNSFSQSKFGKIEKSISDEDLEKMKTEQNLEFLSKTDSYFENAVFNFEQLGERAVEPLANHLRKNKDDKKIVGAVIYTLGRLGKNGARGVSIITPYLKDKDYDIRIAAISALGKIGPASSKAVPLISDFLDDKNEFIREKAVIALEGIGTSEAKQLVNEYKKMQLLLKKRKEREGK